MEHSGKQPHNNQKAAYASPELKIYGTITELTHSGGLGLADLGGSQVSFDNVAPAENIE